LGLWVGDFASWLAARIVVAASLNTKEVVSDQVVDKFSRVFGGSLKLSVGTSVGTSVDDDLRYDFKHVRHFLKTILTSKSL
jgi:hypothetical protein